MPFSISLSDFSGRFPGPVTGRPRRPLSIKESTASCSIRFSFLTMISGAPKSSNLFKRLLRFITLRYKSLRSEVANLPPSSCTIGRNSGGITGTTSIIIQEGLLPDLRKASTTSNRLIARIFLCPLEEFNSARRSTLILSRSSSSKSCFIASAPIPTLKLLPYLTLYSRNSFSVKSCFFISGVSPASSTI